MAVIIRAAQHPSVSGAPPAQARGEAQGGAPSTSGRSGGGPLQAATVVTFRNNLNKICGWVGADGWGADTVYVQGGEGIGCAGALAHCTASRARSTPLSLRDEWAVDACWHNGCLFLDICKTRGA